jgi:glycosyltransferase involved in cell wall biosynthesis
MRIGLLLPSIYMHKRWGEGRIFAPGSLAIALADGLVESGNKVFFYTSPDVQTKAKIIPGDLDLLVKDFEYFLFRNRSEEDKKYTTIEIRKRDYEFDLTTKAYKDAEDGKLDIIHSYHDFGAHYFSELTKFPTVFTLHDPIPKEGDLTVEYFRMKRFAHHNFVSISDNQRVGIPMNFIGTVYHGIHLENYDFGEGKGGYLIHFGRLLEDKGAHTAIEVAKIAKVPLKIATSFQRANMAEKYYLEKIKPHVDGVHVSEIGFMKGKEKSEYINQASAFIFPLQWEEPFGMVLIESMACGTPVIAYARGSVPELVKDGVTGFLVNSSDDKKCGDWVIKKTGIDGLIEAVGRIREIDRNNCRKHVEENFTVEKMTQNYINKYNLAIERYIK